MINKQTKVLAIVLAVLLSGVVGFALFSQQIEIHGTAKAEGNFKVEIECAPGISLGLENTDYIEESNYEKGYSNDSCSVDTDKKTATFHVDLAYPGATRVFTFKITNKGAINAQLRKLTTEYDTEICNFEGEKECNSLKGIIGEPPEDMSGINGIYYQILVASSLISPYASTMLAFETPSGVLKTFEDEDFDDFLADAIVQVEDDKLYSDAFSSDTALESPYYYMLYPIKQGASWYMIVQAQMNEDIDGVSQDTGKNNKFEVNSTFNMTFDFVQAKN